MTLDVIMLNVNGLNVIRLNAIRLNIIMLNAIRLNIIMLNVVAPEKDTCRKHLFCLFKKK
jgi:hypothetical protein